MEVQNQQALVAASQKFAENLEKYPEEEQIAISVISKNVLNGCSWEFVRSSPDIKRDLKYFEGSRFCQVAEVTYSHSKHITGYLISMNMNRLVSILAKEGMGIFGQNDLKLAQNHRQLAIMDCAKIMRQGYKGQIGIYCTNDSHTITVDGSAYPAFAVTLKEICEICQQMNYGFVFQNNVYHPQEVLSKARDVIKACTVAPSSNALLINIVPMR